MCFKIYATILGSCVMDKNRGLRGRNNANETNDSESLWFPTAIIFDIITNI